MRTRITIFGVVLLVVSALAFIVVLKPQATRIADTRKQTEAQVQRTSQLNLELGQLQALEQQAPQLRARAQRVDTAIPNDPELGPFILQVQEAATKSAIDWLAVSPSPPGAGPEAGVLEIGVSMNVNGGYFQIQDFLARLETLGRAVKISGVTLGPGPTGLPQLAGSFTMRMFVAGTPAT